MAAPSPFSFPTKDEPSADKQGLHGEKIRFVGKMTSMSRREVVDLVTRHGAEVTDDDGSSATLLVIGDSHPDLASALQSDTTRSTQSLGNVDALDNVDVRGTTVLHESELWQRMGLVGGECDQSVGVQKLYTPAMLAELLDVPVTAVRRWHRQGTLVACHSVRRLPYFDFSEVAVARHLASLYTAGCSLRVIDRKLAELKRSLPEIDRPLCDPSIVVSGRQLYLRRGDELAEPGGQLLIDFDKPDEEQSAVALTTSQMVYPISIEELTHAEPQDSAASFSTLEELQLVALEWEDQGELARAADTYRTMLVAGGPTAELHFALADLLYRLEDLPAARERYYAAIELDEEYVEARANLGCVLAENGEVELAVAAFQGALAYHVDYADVHYHLAGALDRLDKQNEAELHWQTFLALAPESPWAEIARTRLGLSENGSGVPSNPIS